MKGKNLVGIRNHVSEDPTEESGINQSIMLGDVVWVKIHGSSWWPGQVVDENSVSGSNKPLNRLAGEVLVRLYGSYDYLYVDFMKCRTEFENILMQNNGSYSETFLKALEQDISCTKSRRLKKRASKPREKAKVEASEGKKPKQDGMKNTLGADDPSEIQGTLGKRPEVSVRRKRAVKVDSVAEKSKNEASTQGTLGKRPEVSVRGKKAVKVDGVAEKSKNEASARGTPRRLEDISSPRKKVKHDFHLEKVKEVASKNEVSTNETSKQDPVRKKLKANNSSSVTSPTEKSQLSARRIRVMQSLGLIAPCGSPFRRNGLVLPSL